MKIQNEVLLSFTKKIYWSAFHALHEKTYHACGYPVHYLFQQAKSNVLLVIFSAFSPNLHPTYNYVRTLWHKTNCNLLFIKDDFVNQISGGSYYIGYNGDYHGLDAVSSLIQSIQKRTHATRIIGIGSSKGGTAALYFGIRLSFDSIIIGSCQYAIGSYLLEHKPKSFKALTGKSKTDFEDVTFFDHLLPNVISKYSSKNKPTIFFHYSTKEHTYPEHIQYLLGDLHEHGFQTIDDIAEYEKHTDTAQYFLPYLKKTLTAVLSNDNSTKYNQGGPNV